MARGRPQGGTTRNRLVSVSGFLQTSIRCSNGFARGRSSFPRFPATSGARYCTPSRTPCTSERHAKRFKFLRCCICDADRDCGSFGRNDRRSRDGREPALRPLKAPLASLAAYAALTRRARWPSVRQLPGAPAEACSRWRSSDCSHGAVPCSI